MEEVEDREFIERVVPFLDNNLIGFDWCYVPELCPNPVYMNTVNYLSDEINMDMACLEDYLDEIDTEDDILALNMDEKTVPIVKIIYYAPNSIITLYTIHPLI